jgi:hypothetical protein
MTHNIGRAGLVLVPLTLVHYIWGPLINQMGTEVAEVIMNFKLFLYINIYLHAHNNH